MAQNRFKRIRPVGVRPRPTNTNVDQPPQNFNTSYNNNNSNTSYQSNTDNFDNTYTSSYNETNTFDNDGFYNAGIDDTSNLNSLNDNNNVNNNNNDYNATNDDFNSYDFNNNFDASQQQQQHEQQAPQTMYDNSAMQQTQSSQSQAFSRVRPVPKGRAIPPSRGPNINNFVPNNNNNMNVNNNNNNNNNDNFMNNFTNVQGSSQQIPSGAIGSHVNSSHNNSNSNLSNNGDFLQSAMSSVTGNSMAGAVAAGMFKKAISENEEIGMIFHTITNTSASSFTSLHYYKYYFHVNNSYVLNKLKLLLLPFLKRNGKDWRRKPASSVSFHRGNTNNTSNNNNHNNNNGNNMNGNIHTPSVQPIFNSPYATAVDDVNAPEGYIPLMAVITYIVIMGFLTGTTQGQLFTPQILISTASSAFGGLLFEVILMKLGFYLIGTIANPPILLDLICYSGYKLVFVTLNLLIFIMIDSLIVYYIVSIGTGIIASIFMIQTFRPYFVKMAESNTSLMSNLSQMSMGSMSNVLQGNEPQKLKQVFLAFVGLWQIIFIQFMGRKMA